MKTVLKAVKQVLKQAVSNLRNPYQQAVNDADGEMSYLVRCVENKRNPYPLNTK